MGANVTGLSLSLRHHARRLFCCGRAGAPEGSINCCVFQLLVAEPAGEPFRLMSSLLSLDTNAVRPNRGCRVPAQEASAVLPLLWLQDSEESGR